ncbi:diacylglycerol lipase-alpha isoform X2 [Condylostylus longicornis]|uniref:diacylglycerol lipase-alpha isoform X2 n=1 Tax=Condylostylus longicornis TaxID=2530218 RepID=UPI00244DDA84|nr:diacylglycerol lipase-alpha isoform X2 [Condylostylus longicornis]
MPGLVVFRRRWSVGSDDLIVPGAFLLTIHLIWLLILCISISVLDYDRSILSIKLLWYYKIGYLVILILSVAVELAICITSMRGSILDTGKRSTMNYWIYLKSVVILFDIAWLVLGIIWIKQYYFEAPVREAKEILIGLLITNWILIFTIVVTIWCTFDAAGRSWVKMKKYQRSMRESESRFNYKRSNSMNRNWRQRKVIRAYQDSWDHRCRLLFCCMGASDRTRNSFTDIARLLSDFFRELDVVPSDVVAGLVLLRKFQKLEREAIVRQRKNGTYEFLSGVPITERTQFLALNDAKDYDFFQTVIHYMYFAQGAYGWPMYLMMNRCRGVCQLCPELRCLPCCCSSKDSADIIKDNCCLCNYAALKKTLSISDVEVIYATYHVDIGETPFFVAIDYSQKKIVISIRGTLSMQDVITDLNAEGEVLPLEPAREDWLGHKGMVQAAIYIKNKLEEENLIDKALQHNPDKGTEEFGLTLVGHSLGAGTAAILAILMKTQYPSLLCYSYSPPGGLLSMPAVEASKSFITSVVVGKDVVPRIGLHQMEALRADLINAIKRSVDPKWKTITCSAICCGCGPEPTSVVEMASKDTRINQYKEQRDTARTTSVHPTDSSIALTFHQPLYPPGRIIHIVRHHPKPDEKVLKKPEPVYQAIWADTTDFDEVIISPVMLQDHMPDKVLSALKKVVTTIGPRKPQRQPSNAYVTLPTDIPDTVHFNQFLNQGCEPSSLPPILGSNQNISNQLSNRAQSPLSLTTNSLSTPTTQHKLCLETSFTNLQSPQDSNSAQRFNMSSSRPESKASSIGGSVFNRSQISTSTVQQFDINSVLDDDTTAAQSPSFPSEATTIIMADGVTIQMESHNPLQNFQYPLNGINNNNMSISTIGSRSKVVAFDIEATNITTAAIISKSPSVSPQVQTRGILHRHQSDKAKPRSSKKPSSLPIPLRRSSLGGDIKPIDLIHDDWFGLAPLASPETLSEISSISSRTSNALSLANSIERYLQKMSVNENSVNNTVVEEVFESQLHTPKVMRRAPKFTENLANCANDSRAHEQYKRMGQIFLTSPRFLRSQDSQDSSQDSFESASSNLVSNRQDEKNTSSITNSNIIDPKIVNASGSKSADNLEESPLQKTLHDDENQNKKLTFSDSNILSTECQSLCPKCPCKSFNGNIKECCKLTDHSSCFNKYSTILTTNTSSCDTYYSASASSIDPSTLVDSKPRTPTIEVFSTPQSHCSANLKPPPSPELPRRIINFRIPEETIKVVQEQNESGVLESHFPCLDEELLLPKSKNNNSNSNNLSSLENTNTSLSSSDQVSLLPTESPKKKRVTISNRENNKNNNNSVHFVSRQQPGRVQFNNNQKPSPIIKKRNGNNSNSNGVGGSTNNDKIFTKNDSLPLLSHLTEARISSPGFVKRKSCIYPANSSASPSKQQQPSTSGKTESYV